MRGFPDRDTCRGLFYLDSGISRDLTILTVSFFYDKGTLPIGPH